MLYSRVWCSRDEMFLFYKSRYLTLIRIVITVYIVCWLSFRVSVLRFVLKPLWPSHRTAISYQENFIWIHLDLLKCLTGACKAVRLSVVAYCINMLGFNGGRFSNSCFAGMWENPCLRRRIFRTWLETRMNVCLLKRKKRGWRFHLNAWWAADILASSVCVRPNRTASTTSSWLQGDAMQHAIIACHCNLIGQGWMRLRIRSNKHLVCIYYPPRVPENK